MRSFKKTNRLWLIPLALILAIGIYFLPPLHDRLATRLDLLRSSIFYFFNPPDKAVFQPGGETNLTIETAIATARAEYLLTLTPQVASVESTPTVSISATPTIYTTPLPASVDIKVTYVDQRNRWNYCGPANLSMALKYWGWTGNRDDIAKVVKPGIKDPKLDFIQQGRSDVNVMPYELVDYVNDNTEFHALSRLGGDIDLAKKLLAAGFPFIAEKGYYEKDYTGKIAWLGHYQFVTGYDDAIQELIVQDTWNDGPNFHIPYDEFIGGEAWLSFDNIFFVVYPPDREAELLNLLGPYADERWAAQHALSVAENDVKTMSGIDLFFAWFAEGTSHIALQEYVDAATAYDQAFAIYNSIGADNIQRPYRTMWYQTGPYWAYFYSARYQDVIDLANVTLTETISKPTLEESIYWRGRAEYMLGDTNSAVADYREGLRLHPNWGPAIQALQDLGLQP